MDIRQIILAACKTQSLTHAGLARLAGVERINLGKWLRQKNASTSTAILAPVLDVLKLTIVPVGTLAPVMVEPVDDAIARLKEQHKSDLARWQEYAMQAWSERNEYEVFARMLADKVAAARAADRAERRPSPRLQAITDELPTTQTRP